MKLAICGLLLCANVAQAGLKEYSNLVVADAKAHAGPADGAIRVTYLGVNGYQFETGRHVLLVDPYFTRVGFWSVALNQPIASERPRVDESFTHLLTPADAVLVTHAHFDHLLDVPAVLERTGAELLTLKGIMGEVMKVAFSPDGKSVATGSGDHRARIWYSDNTKVPRSLR